MSPKENKCKCYAIIGKGDPRYEIWIKILGKPEIPLKHPLTHKHPQFGVMYEGDPQRLTTEQKERMADLLSEKFKIPREEVLTNLAKGVMAVKAENCSVAICNLHVRCMM